MRPGDGLLAELERVFAALGEDGERVVLVGGLVAALYDLPLVPRPTKDVDLTIDVTRPEFYALLARLKMRGFRECRDEGAPVCRLEIGQPRVLVDVMPTNPDILGFSNRWYADAVRSAANYRLPGGREIRALTPEYLVATKLDAFHGRGKQDFQASHDLEDALGVLAGDRHGLRESIVAAATPVCAWLRDELARLAANDDFLDAVFFHFPGTKQGEEFAASLTRWLAGLGGDADR